MHNSGLAGADAADQAALGAQATRPAGAMPTGGLKRTGNFQNQPAFDGYLNLCRNPSADVLRWLKESDDTPGVGMLTRPTTKGDT